MKKINLFTILVLVSAVSFAGCKKDSVTKTYKLNVTATNGTVVKNPDLAAYNSGATVQLTATPNSGYTFTGWSGDVTGTSNPKTVEMEGNKTVTATFLKQTVYTLTVACDPTAGGSVVLNPAGGTYVAGTAVTMTAKANSGYTFTGWSGDVTGSTNPLPITMNVNKNIAANFSAADNTAELQALIDQCPTNGTVSIPAGTYMIDALKHLNLKSNMTLKMESGAILKAIPNDSPNYNIISMRDASNVTVIGGTVQGERNQHTDNPVKIAARGFNEEGMGIGIYESHHVLIDGVTAKDCWGDGFFIGEWGNSTTDVTIQNVIADNNRRQGLSIVSADGVIVRNSVFKNTHGTSPMAGIDVEPDENQTVKNVQILNNELYGNYHGGICVARGDPARGLNQTIGSVTISGNNVHNNGTTDANWYYGIYLEQASGVIVTGNNVHNNINAGEGIAITNNSDGNTITNNTVVNNGHMGIYIPGGCTGNTVTGNTITGNPSGNIVEELVGTNYISGNITN